MDPHLASVPAPALGVRPLTIGVEEEFFVTDTATREAAARGSALLAGARLASPGVSGEITRFQVESQSPVCRTAGELREHIAAGRLALARAAGAHGLEVAATGTAVLGDTGSAPLSEGARYLAIAQHFGALRDAHTVCGCHVHIGIADRGLALATANHLRPWLPTLLALTANSPFQHGRDTGHASWRSITWSQLPSAGPPPWLGSPAEHRRAVEELLKAGAALDERMVYWDLRLSAHLPTLEVRVGDTAATAEESLLFAVLVRGLAAVALAHAQDGRPAPALDDRRLRLAMWRAAREGLEGDSLDPVSGDLVPARHQVKSLMSEAVPGLCAHGDADLVHDLITRLFAVGSGAHRQRLAHDRCGSMRDVVDLLVLQTRHGLAAIDT